MKRTLILNATYQPLTIISVKRGLILSFKDNGMKVLSYYDDCIISEKQEHKLPAVMWYPNFINVAKKRTPTKRTILARDGYSCQYCFKNLGRHEATVDHVIPVCRFKNKKEANTWENMVACCQKCNSKKGDSMLQDIDLKLIRKPKPPTSFLDIRNPPVEWKDFIR